jgi:HK97 gp10 family phage protein
MASVVTVEVKGLRELGERLKALGLDFKEGSRIARATTNAGAQVIKKLAIQKAPASPPQDTPAVPPNYLKSNIIVRYVRKSRLSSEHKVTIRSKGKGVLSEEISANPYAIGVYQEFGTVHHGPQPFMRPAFDQGKTAAVEAMKKRLTLRIEKAERGGK